jgi:preprotein translocase subunit SecD
VDATRVSFAIHLVAAGPGRGVVMASSWQDGESVHVHSERQVSNVDVEAARVARTDSGCQVDIRLTGAGSRKLSRLTRNHVGERLALVIDGKVAMTPTIRSEITQGAVALTGDFTDARCEEIARGLSVRQ